VEKLRPQQLYKNVTLNTHSFLKGERRNEQVEERRTGGKKQ
jgi:hypothetical protein